VSRLVVVSNRVTPATSKATLAGGLAVGVLAALRQSGGIWFGWSGEVADVTPNEPNVLKAGRISYITLDLSEQDHQGYYNGFSNRSLWPLLHYRLDLATFDSATYAAYRRVNQLFAQSLAPHLRPSDLIWVHDYHLIPCGHELRRLGVDAPLGFFLHIPFPAPELFVALPWHQPLMQAFAAYDLIGFQTRQDADNFLRYFAQEGMGSVIGDGLLEVDGRRVRVGAFPIGVDADNFAAMATSYEGFRQARRLRQSLLGRHLVIGVDRLDYSKGIIERLRAFEALLEHYPRQQGQVSFVQISAPSREQVPEYLELRRAVEATCGRINGRFEEFDWTPIRYLHRSFSRRSLAGFFRVSRVGLVTPLRDGMNLVAKEYVMAQDAEDPGVLVLSRFSGAANELKGPLIVNPYDLEGVAEALQIALEMPLEERKERWAGMVEHLRQHDVSRWREEFVDELSAVRH
jgi:trehalose 6-phosphate synthase